MDLTLNPPHGLEPSATSVGEAQQRPRAWSGYQQRGKGPAVALSKLFLCFLSSSEFQAGAPNEDAFSLFSLFSPAPGCPGSSMARHDLHLCAPGCLDDGVGYVSVSLLNPALD